jgi:hypothetical protein
VPESRSVSNHQSLTNMALPSLEHQIRFVDSIVLTKAIKNPNDKFEYVVEEIFKSRYDSMQTHTLLKADLSLFELLGYSIENNQQAIVFLAEKKNGGFDCIDFLPVCDGSIAYGVDDATVHRQLTLSEFRELASAVNQ